MIDEKKLTQDLETMISDVPISYMEDENHDRLNAYNYALSKAISIIKNQPKVGEWIPVEEGLPNYYYEPVLVTYLYFPNQKIYDDEIAYLDACGNWDWDTKEDIESAEIMAWMPLPEPYKKN